MALPSVSEVAAALDSLALAMLTAAAGSAIILALAALAARVLRRASAAARHEVWLLGFGGALVLPLLSALLPGWPILARLAASNHAPRPARVVDTSSDLRPSVPSALVAANVPDHKETLMNTEPKVSASDSTPTVAKTSAALRELVAPNSPEPLHSSTRAGQLRGMPWTVWLTLFWLLGTLAVLCRVLLGHLSLWSLRRRCRPIAHGESFELLDGLRGKLGVRRPVELLSSPSRLMPMTWGMWRARLLVPEQAATWPQGQRRDVLLHELGHVKRSDCLTQFLSQFACALYWFNPLAWLAARRMQIEQERACDDLVLNHGVEAPAYARHLLDSVSCAPAFRLAGVAVAMARPSTLEERVRAILDTRLNRRSLSAGGSFATILLLLTALVPVAVLKAQQSPPDEAPARSEPSQPTTKAAPISPATRRAANYTDGRPVFPGARNGGHGNFGADLPAPTLGEGPTCTLDATLYDVRIPADQIGRLDVDALAKASQTADAFEKALATLGTVKPLYRASQSVRLSGDTITIGTQVPLVTSSRTSETGQVINSVQHRLTGAIFNVAGKTGGPGGIDLDLGIELSLSSDGGIPITNKMKAAVMRTSTLSHKGPVDPGKSFVVLSVDAGLLDEGGKAVAYIGRITIGQPQPAAPR